MLLLNEVYFGKTKDIQAIEDQLGKFRSRYMGTKMTERLNINSDKELLKFNRMMEDFFGFGVFSLHIVDQPIKNAYTFSISRRFDTRKSTDTIIVDKRTYKFKKEYDYTCLTYIYSGIIFNEVFTDEEIMAVILHEVGHNFYCCLRHQSSSLSTVYTLLIAYSLVIDTLLAITRADISKITTNIKSAVISTESLQKVLHEFERECRQNKNIISILLDVSSFFENISTTLGVSIISVIDKMTLGIRKIPNAILRVLYSLPTLPLSYLVNWMGYQDEQTADNFATMYGYGGALVSALGKMQDYNVTMSKLEQAYFQLPLISTIYALNAQVARLITDPFDPHPSYVSRATDQIEMLNAEVTKQNMDPKMKKALLSDIRAIEKAMDKYMLSSKGVSDPNYFRIIYNKTILSKGGNFKDTIYSTNPNDRFEDYDDIYKERRIK